MSLTIDYVKAEWCGSCKVLLPQIEKLCNRFNVKLDVLAYEEMEEDEQEQISSLPAVRVFHGEKIIEDITKDKLKRLEEILTINSANEMLDADF